jgi:hypothetical protein
MARSLPLSDGMTTHETFNKTVSQPTHYQASEDFYTKEGPAQLPGALEHAAVGHSEKTIQSHASPTATTTTLNPSCSRSSI